MCSLFMSTKLKDRGRTGVLFSEPFSQCDILSFILKRFIFHDSLEETFSRVICVGRITCLDFMFDGYKKETFIVNKMTIHLNNRRLRLCRSLWLEDINRYLLVPLLELGQKFLYNIRRKMFSFLYIMKKIRSIRT